MGRKQSKGCLFVYFHSILSDFISCYVLNVLHWLNKVFISIVNNTITFFKKRGVDYAHSEALTLPLYGGSLPVWISIPLCSFIPNLVIYHIMNDFS